MSWNQRAEAIPHVVGLCCDCRREMWTGWPGAPVRVSKDPRWCQGCENWRTKHPGGDPTLARGTHAERIPAEWAEGDQRWKARGSCADTDEPELFGPAPDADDLPPGFDPGLFAKGQAYAVEAYCSFCPVINVCRAKAQFHGYEGVWGGAVFDRETWHSPITGASGTTIHHPATLRVDRGYPPAVDTAEEGAAA